MDDLHRGLHGPELPSPDEQRHGLVVVLEPPEGQRRLDERRDLLAALRSLQRLVDELQAQLAAVGSGQTLAEIDESR